MGSQVMNQKQPEVCGWLAEPQTVYAFLGAAACSLCWGLVEISNSQGKILLTEG